MFQGDPRDMRRYMALSQVGLEMVAPIGVGLAVDHFLGWFPWGTICGAALGLTAGLVHLIYFVSKDDPDSSPPKPKSG